MSLVVALGVGLIGGLGALARFALDGFVSGRAGGAFPGGRSS
jgi:fluoride ion exporter CrcB/FEX